VGREPTRQYNAFVFDNDTIEIDRRTVAWVDSRDGQFADPPLVAAFRCRGPAPSEAFTYTAINVQISRSGLPRSWRSWRKCSAPFATTAATKTTSC